MMISPSLGFGMPQIDFPTQPKRYCCDVMHFEVTLHSVAHGVLEPLPLAAVNLEKDSHHYGD
jgi:hypothetical protein